MNWKNRVIWTSLDYISVRGTINKDSLDLAGLLNSQKYNSLIVPNLGSNQSFCKISQIRNIIN